MELVCAVQNYEWGVKGYESLVGKLAQANTIIENIEEKPYAEFWIGTHPNGPSVIKHNRVLLSEHIRQNPEELGDGILKCFGQQLPFLFKILSVNKALSIQTHPTKAQAKDLFKEGQNIYKDTNHKPELAIALSKFKALCSFRPLEDIKFYLEKIPEFQLLIHNEKIKDFINCSDDKDKEIKLMKECFQSLMLCPDNIVKSAVDNLVNRLKRYSEKEDYTYDLVMKLNNEFPGDIGIFCIYWLNYIELNPGEAIYIAPNEPHAYLSGNCVECMANSDNVIRAGLTPKFRDVKTLCEMLSFNSYHPSDIILRPMKENKFNCLFSPPVRDFAVVQIIIPSGEEYTLTSRKSASLLIIIDGRGLERSGRVIHAGTVFYLPSDAEFSVKSEETVTIFQAFSNI